MQKGAEKGEGMTVRGMLDLGRGGLTYLKVRERS